MIRLGEIVAQYESIRRKKGFHKNWVAVFCFLTGFAAAAFGQSALKSDWSNLVPPPGALDTNSIHSDLASSNYEAFETEDFSENTNASGTNSFRASLAMAEYYEKTSQPESAEPILIGLLAANVPESIQKRALMRLGAVARDENDLSRAETIYQQYLDRWPDDANVPEVLLRQGEIFRQMGLTDLALGKFYSVMASAITLKNGQFAFYQKLVLQTQVEIAETHYLMGHYVDAADFYNRLLQNPDPALNRPQIQFRLIRSLAIIGRNNEAASQAQDFLTRYPNAEETPEVRYYFAQALKGLGRNDEALEQVILCLKQQKSEPGIDPNVWLYWQERVGNEIANDLYHQGDYVQALEIYVDLSQLDSTPSWQIPVLYQMGLSYEKLMQPQKAMDAYKQILARQSDVGTNATPGMQAVFGMAQWRIQFLQWEQHAQAEDISLAASMPFATTNSETNSIR